MARTNISAAITLYIPTTHLEAKQAIDCLQRAAFVNALNSANTDGRQRFGLHDERRNGHDEMRAARITSKWSQQNTLKHTKNVHSHRHSL
jgi:hypothetical protein